MVDLSKLRKGAPKPPGVAPSAPRPDSDLDLPAPAPPAQAPPGTQKGTGAQEPGPPPTGPPTTEEVMAKVAGGVRNAPAAGKPGIDTVKPLKMPQPRQAAAHGDISDTVGIHGSPPVFIKIDKYTEIVKNLGNLKSYALSLRDALDAIADIEKELTTGITIAHKALDDFNTIIAVLDSKLLRASAIKDMDVSAPGDVDKYIKGIYDQMERIKSELKAI